MNDVSPSARRNWMSTLSTSAPGRLAALLPDLPDHALLRSPEIGAVMVRGRAGATGAAFNLGEMTVTRCSVRLQDGVVGHAWVQGRDKDHARRAAVVDGLMQTDRADYIRQTILAPLAAEALAARRSRAEKAAATKVDFFTMVRGEDR
ncbi:MAG: phosphonate C-P lyase system protein PhnG [Tabrizicola sp.]|nr:phosphonate C-P lyase system protein PhnG [Tabrizicola sp.]